MRSIVRPLLAAAIGILVAQCGEPSLTAPQPSTALPRTLSAAETGLITADNRFAFNLFGEIARQASPDSNLFVSPLSAAMALAMAYNGAGGTTRPGTFRLANGAATMVPMMTHGHTVRVGYARAEGVTVLDLPYGGEAFSMTIALPQDAAGIDSLVQGLTEERWRGWVAALDSGSFEVVMPKFALTYGLTMNDVLKALGMPSAFCDSWHPDFTRMNPTGALCITDVRHKAFVDVNEEGTEAAAATSVGIGFTSIGPTLVMVDRPFVFAIRERLSGTILFLGRVMNPAAT